MHSIREITLLLSSLLTFPHLSPITPRYSESVSHFFLDAASSNRHPTDRPTHGPAAISYLSLPLSPCNVPCTKVSVKNGKRSERECARTRGTRALPPPAPLPSEVSRDTNRVPLRLPSVHAVKLPRYICGTTRTYFGAHTHAWIIPNDRYFCCGVQFAVHK